VKDVRDFISLITSLHFLDHITSELKKPPAKLDLFRGDPVLKSTEHVVGSALTTSIAKIGSAPEAIEEREEVS
jgi:hypothetical protein